MPEQYVPVANARGSAAQRKSALVGECRRTGQVRLAIGSQLCKLPHEYTGANPMNIYRCLLVFFVGVLTAQAQSNLYGGLRWRSIGPPRGGRTVAIAGIPSQPNVFYCAATNGGVWKTTDFGRVWD